MKTKNRDNRDAPENEPLTHEDQVDSAAEESGVATPPDPQAEIDALKDALLRGKADFANFQRRAAIDRADAIRFANAELLKSLLSALDDFDRTIGAAESSDNLNSVVEGVELVHANLIKALQDSGLEEIPALHQTFDPTIHEALLQQPTDAHPPGTVVEQVAKGYRLRDRVLRPAKVIVAKATGENQAPEGDSDRADGSAGEGSDE
jgi:molecular chaperone GrpE